MRLYRSIVYENAILARILPCFCPSLVTGKVSEGKMVDFVLTPCLGPELGIAIQKQLIELSK